MQRILIIGANSFIGQNLIDRLDKNNVVCKTVFKSLLTSSNSFRMDISRKASIKATLKRYAPDIVINTSQYGGFRSQKRFNEMVKVNVIGVQNLIECLSADQYLIHLGTSSEYGNNRGYPMLETATIYPETKYGITKATGSIIASKRKNTIVLRPFSPFGKYEKNTRLIPYLIDSMVKNKDIYLNTPSAVHDFFHVDYLVDIIEYIINDKENVFNLKNKIFNVGTGVDVSVSDITMILKGIIGYSNMIDYNHSADVEYYSWKADTVLTNKHLLPYKSSLLQDLRKAVSCYL